MFSVGLMIWYFAGISPPRPAPRNTISPEYQITVTTDVKILAGGGGWWGKGPNSLCAKLVEIILIIHNSVSSSIMYFVLLIALLVIALGKMSRNSQLLVHERRLYTAIGVCTYYNSLDYARKLRHPGYPVT